MASGGYGHVFLGHQEAVGRDVAIKVLHRVVDPTAAERFARECRALGRLSDQRGIVTIYDVGTLESGSRYVLMQWADGGSLQDVLGLQGHLGWRTAMRLGGQAASALSIVHAEGILHRDIKPGNLLLSNRRVLVADFGIAKLRDDTTITDGFVGTLAYMDPHALSQGTVFTEKSDVYSLAATILEVATGESLAPKEATPAQVAAWAIGYDKLPPGIAAGCPEVVAAALDPDPASRPTMEGFAAALRPRSWSPRHFSEKSSQPQEEGLILRHLVVDDPVRVGVSKDDIGIFSDGVIKSENIREVEVGTVRDWAVSGLVSAFIDENGSLSIAFSGRRKFLFNSDHLNRVWLAQSRRDIFIVCRDDSSLYVIDIKAVRDGFADHVRIVPLPTGSGFVSNETVVRSNAHLDEHTGGVAYLGISTSRAWAVDTTEARLWPYDVRWPIAPARGAVGISASTKNGGVAQIISGPLTNSRIGVMRIDHRRGPSIIDLGVDDDLATNLEKGTATAAVTSFALDNESNNINILCLDSLTIDPNTGSIEVRHHFGNPKGGEKANLSGVVMENAREVTTMVHGARGKPVAAIPHDGWGDWLVLHDSGGVEVLQYRTIEESEGHAT